MLLKYEKSILQKGDLAAHKSIHSGKNPLNCENYGKAFLRNGDFAGHCKLIHVAEKAFKSKECNKSFKQKDVLSGHKRSHSGESLFQCR